MNAWNDHRIVPGVLSILGFTDSFLFAKRFMLSLHCFMYKISFTEAIYTQIVSDIFVYDVITINPRVKG